MNLIEKYMPAVLNEVDRYIPIGTAATGVLLSAHGIQRIVKQGFSIGAVAETALGIGIAVLSGVRLMQTLEAQAVAQDAVRAKELCSCALPTVSDVTKSFLRNLVGLNTTDIPIRCIVKSEQATLLGFEAVECVVTVTKDNIVGSGFGVSLIQYYERSKDSCVGLTDGESMLVRTFGGPCSRPVGVDTAITFEVK